MSLRLLVRLLDWVHRYYSMSDANLQTMYMLGRHTEMPADAEMRVPIPVLSHPNQTTPPYAAENPEKKCEMRQCEIKCRYIQYQTAHGFNR
jgi:hypothetical protein